MTNSDPFEHMHRMRDSRYRQALQVARRQLDALEHNLDPMLQARRVDQLAPGTGLAGAGSRGGGHADPTARTALTPDRSTAVWAAWDLAWAEFTHAADTLTRLTQGTLHDPTPTGLCRDGACPEGKMADRGTRSKEGIPRCHACYRFWLLDVSNPNDPDEPRQERQYPGQSPRRIGLNKDAVA